MGGVGKTKEKKIEIESNDILLKKGENKISIPLYS
jgi:hypothetical protein